MYRRLTVAMETIVIRPEFVSIDAEERFQR